MSEAELKSRIIKTITWNQLNLINVISIRAKSYFERIFIIIINEKDIFLKNINW